LSLRRSRPVPRSPLRSNPKSQPKRPPPARLACQTQMPTGRKFPLATPETLRQDPSRSAYRVHRGGIGTARSGPRGESELEIVLIRHAQPDWEPNGRAVDDPGLTEFGAEQARCAAAHLAGQRFDALYVSPLRRVIETADPIAKQLGLEPRVRPWLRELGLPSLAGKNSAQVRAFFSQAHARELEHWWDGMPGGESFRHFYERVSGGIEALLAGAGRRPARVDRGPRRDQCRASLSPAGDRARSLGLAALFQRVDRSQSDPLRRHGIRSHLGARKLQPRRAPGEPRGRRARRRTDVSCLIGRLGRQSEASSSRVRRPVLAAP